MALIKCTECGCQVSDKAAACPHCGCPTHDVTLTASNGRKTTETVPSTKSPASGGVPIAIKMPEAVETVVSASATETATKPLQNPLYYMPVFGLIGGFLAWLLVELSFMGLDINDINTEAPNAGGRTILAILAIAVTFAVSLAIAEHVVLRHWRRVILTGTIAALWGIASVLGFMFGGVCLALFGGMSENIFGAIAFGTFGLCVMAVPGIIARNWKRICVGLAGGFVGGCSGTWLFIQVDSLTQNLHAGGFVALATLGLVASTFLGLIRKRPKKQYVWLMGIIGLCILCCIGIVSLILIIGPKQPVQKAISKGNICSEKGDYDSAVVAFTEAIQFDPKLAMAYYNRGNAYRRKGDLDKAIADYTEAIRLDPKDAKAYNNRGLAYRNKNNLDKAIADYTEAIRLDPKLALAYNNRGLAYRNKNNLDKAIADFTEAIRLNPQYVEAYYNRGNAYGKKGDLDKAIADHTETIRLDPKCVSAYCNRGLGYRLKGDFDKAIGDCTEAIRLNPQYAEAYVQRGMAYAAKGKPVSEAGKSVEIIEKALKSPTEIRMNAIPLEDVVEYLKGLHRIPILLDTKALAEAKITTDAPVTLDVKGVSLRSGLQLMLKPFGLTYTIQYEVLLITTPKEVDRDIADFTEAIRLDPKLAEAFFNRGCAYKGKGDSDKAIEDFTEAIRLNPNLAEPYYHRGITYRVGHRDAAIADFSEAIRLNPKYAEAYYRRGKLYQENEDKSKAEEDFAKAKSLGYKSE